MTQTQDLMTETQARTFREAYAAAVKRYSRMTKAQLQLEVSNARATAGRYVVYGGASSKDELIRDMMDLRGYTVAKMNESIHVLYHVDGITNDICEWCNPNPCPACGALSTCAYDSEHGPVVNGRHVSA
jgi:hypothetical protein